MLPTAADPTDVVGRRIGAYAIDGIVSMLLALVALLIVQPQFWETQTVASAATAEATCWDFDAASGQDPTGNGQFERPDADAVSFGDHDPDRELCLPIEDQIVWVDPVDAIWAYLRIVAVAWGLTQLNLIVLQSITGASIGKLCVGLRVVREDGTKANVWRIVLRQLFMLVDTAFASIVGLVTMLTSRGHQRVGDMVAKTYVVRTASMGAPLQIPPKGVRPGTWAPPPAAYAPPPHPDGPHWDPQRLTWIRYDRAAEHWTMWDDARREWREIDT